MLTGLAILCAFFSFVISVDVFFGVKQMRKLVDYPLAPDFIYPSLSIVFAARNEERNIESAVRSLLAIDYPNLQIVAVNDRSTDKTTAILKKLKTEFPTLKLIEITELPKGWLGKNHALYVGTKESQSELILFTDADVIFEKDSLKKAVQCLNQEGWDHLTLTPHIIVPGFILNLCVGVFGMLFFSYIRPWKAKDPKSPYHLGVGAFNLIRRSVYEKIGTFEALRLRPDDDVKLGKLVKLKGFKQIVFLGKDACSVEWYSTVREFVKGLEKNVYPGSDYRFFFMVLSTTALFITYILPYLILPFVDGVDLLLFCLCIVFQLLCFVYTCEKQGTPKKTFIAFPLGSTLYLYVIWNAILKCVLKNGIEWRGTFYSLDELKKNRI